MLIGQAEGGTALRNARGGRVEVDLLPGVTMPARWPTHGAAGDEETRQTRDTESLRLLQEMEALAAHNRILLDRLQHTLGASAANRQLPSKKKKPDRH